MTQTEGNAWSNWSGGVTATPTQRIAPKSKAELAEFLAASDGTVRVEGAGHSFTPVVATQGSLVSLRDMAGDVMSADAGKNTVKVNAGASLNALSKVMQTQGLAFKNLGDIDVQSFAGATSTATHGTGKAFPCLSAEIEELSLLTATGETVKASADENVDIFNAGRVAVGGLGIITEATVSVRPAFKLHRNTSVVDLKDMLAHGHDLWDRHRNFEFFYIPFCDRAVQFIHNETDAAEMTSGDNDDDASLKQLQIVRNVTRRMPSLRRFILNKAISLFGTEENQIGTSWQLLSNERNFRFNEMEYHLPVDTAFEAMAELVHAIEKANTDVFFPIECRQTAGDDAWLSPFEGGPRVSIAVHAGHRDDYKWFYEIAEPIFRRYGGRPHWGKMHSLVASDLHELYPNFQRFLDVRKTLDPKGRFLNAHTAKLWGVAGGSV